MRRHASLSGFRGFARRLCTYAPALIIGKSWAPRPALSLSSPSLVLVSDRSGRRRHAPREGGLQAARAGGGRLPRGEGRPRLMGSWLSSCRGSSSASGEGSRGVPVILNVYDLTTWNNYTYWCGVGIFHSGIEGELCSCLLPESLQMPVVKQTPEYHVYSEDGSECLSIITANEPTESEDADQDKHLLSPSSGGEVAFIREVHR
ncbi:hypothetical protein Taro_012908 [Colocasia esculenta]|uniref:PPPDE domain-containing protein n=1 Tax=Colocasia esculenta TaxID=4460 RepID=A0A843UE31_COLES|nr:hypothetical protein [Colocasia esculenta]